MGYCMDCNRGFVDMGPTNRSGPHVFELCRCQPPQTPQKLTNPDDLIDAELRKRHSDLAGISQ